MMTSVSRVWLFVTPWTVAYQAPLSMEFSIDQNTGMGGCSLIQGIFPTQRLKLGLTCHKIHPFKAYIFGLHTIGI